MLKSVDENLLWNLGSSDCYWKRSTTKQATSLVFFNIYAAKRKACIRKSAIYCNMLVRSHLSVKAHLSQPCNQVLKMKWTCRKNVTLKARVY